MKLQFDPNQTFQLDAVAAVTDLFQGQPQGAPEYAVIKMGEMGGLFAGQDRTELGVGNRLLLADEKLATNTRVVQAREDIEVEDPAAPLETWELFDAPANLTRPCPHFSVEMETGTGKTYVYLRTVFELSRRGACRRTRPSPCTRSS
jgi:type III restriction enzyme